MHVGCGDRHSFKGKGRGPAVYYGYCSETGQMRMMDYADYVGNIQNAYSKLYSTMYGSPGEGVQSWLESMRALMPGGPPPHHGDRCCCPRCKPHAYGRPQARQHRRDDDCCGCEVCGGCGKYDCHCDCCVRDADAVEFARCGETRLISLTFENDTRRERDVKLELGAFATAGGAELGWEATFSESEFKLPPCGEKTVTLKVVVDCGRLSGRPNEERRQPSLDECKVAYATVRAEGCLVRPLVVAVAVLPNDCGAHQVGCGCSCCC